MQDENFEEILSSSNLFATPSISRHGTNRYTNGSSSNGNYSSGTATPSTWMTEQRNKRAAARRKGYGRRFSRSNVSNFALSDFDSSNEIGTESIDGSDEGDLGREVGQEKGQDSDPNAGVQENHHGEVTGQVKALNASGKSRTGNGSTSGSIYQNRYPTRRLRSLRSSGDLSENIDEHEVKAKKKRPNIPRSGKPPLPSYKVNSAGIGDAATRNAADNSKASSAIRGGKSCSLPYPRSLSTNDNSMDAFTGNDNSSPPPQKSYSVSQPSPFLNTRRRILRRSQSLQSWNSTASPAAANAAASAARLLEENVHPNDTAIDEVNASKMDAKSSGSKPTTSASNVVKVDHDESDLGKKRANKKRTASTTGIGTEIKASPPKIAHRRNPSTSVSRSLSSSSFSGTASSSFAEDSFSNLAKRAETPSWGHKRSFSQSYGCKTPASTTTMVRQRSYTTESESDWKERSLFLSPTSEEGNVLSTPIVGTILKTGTMSTCFSVEEKSKNGTCSYLSMADATPSVCEILSPPPSMFGGINVEISMVGHNLDLTDTMDSARVIEESDDNDTTSSCEQDSVDSSTSEDSVQEVTQRVLTDAEIFETKPSYEDFKFLIKSLMKWSQTAKKNAKGASMGLNNGCLIAVPSQWTFERRATFVKWASVACGFRVGSVGGAGGSFLRCVDSAGLHTLSRLRHILVEYKAGRLVGTLDKKDKIDAIISSRGVKSAANLSINSANRTKAISPFPFSCDDEDDELAVAFDEQVTIQKKKEKPNASNVPSLMRSISLQPLARVMKSPLPYFRQSPSSGSERKLSRLRLSSESAIHDQTLSTIDSDRNLSRPPRPSSERAMNGTDFLNQIHGASPLSPIAHAFPRKFRERASRLLNPKRPSLEKQCLSFDNTAQIMQPFESPHPRNASCIQNTPLIRIDFESDRPWETPMLKQVEHWGSRPIAGKDWGAMACCDIAILNCCKRVFAQNWLNSDFYQNEELCDLHKLSFPEEEQSSLHGSFDSDSDVENDDVDFDAFSNNLSPGTPPLRKFNLHRADSVGGCALALLHLDDHQDSNPLPNMGKRRSLKLRKYGRISLCAAALDFLHPKRPIRLSNSPTKHEFGSPGTSILNEVLNGPSLGTILSFFNLPELLQCASLVCTSWADAAADAMGTLVIASVGCDTPFMISQMKDSTADETETPRDEEGSTEDSPDAGFHLSTAAKTMKKDWSYLVKSFATGKFLSEGAFKKVYKVWNTNYGAYEALSVMDVDTIAETGNLHTVGAELAVSVLLSSIARRNIAPNFVITRGIFTCQYDLPSNDWDDTCNEGEVLSAAKSLKQGDCGKFQYIRMELCKHKDIEDYIRNLPKKMLAPSDCRHLLFQMAFALHVASDKLGMKHYDVKLLNFFLQSALNDSIPEHLHPHVVLRYGVGSSVFRLRMKPSTALIVKLADFGTAVLRTDADGQPISLGQFTTFENTPPDYLILGNNARQGYGHDCFGLGLCMLHLFTGHDPYEEILKSVICPDAFKTKLRKIWKGKSHNIICSAMMYEGQDGAEIEDETLYNTLYRFLVLFGVPQNRFQYKENAKVWRAISSCLLKDGPDASVFESDRRVFSLADGNNDLIANARRRLEEMDGAMDLLYSLVCFDPKKRATPLDVINSRFMTGLIETKDSRYDDRDIVKSYMSYYSTK